MPFWRSLARSPLIRALRLRREARRHAGFSFRKLAEIEARAKHSDVWKTLEGEVAGYLTLDFGDPQDALKYLHTDYWLRANILRAARLGLHQRPRRRILDLGSGSAIFPYVCSLLGHDATGLDQPLECCRPDEYIVYSVMPSVLGVSIQRTSIEALTPLALTDRYDLVTAFMICFNAHQRPDEWGRDEWRFFLTDVCQHVNPGGRVCLAFNPHVEKYGKLKYYDESILSLFSTWGSIEREGHVTILRDRVVGQIAVPSAKRLPASRHERRAMR